METGESGINQIAPNLWFTTEMFSDVGMAQNRIFGVPGSNYSCLAGAGFKEVGCLL